MRSRSWLQWTVFTVGIAGFTAMDVFLAYGQWRVFFFVAMAALGILALRGKVAAWAIGLVSLLGTAAILVTNDPADFATSFGVGETFILLVLIATSFRRAAAPVGWLRVALVVLAVLCVPIREWSADTLNIEVVFAALTGCALAGGAVLRNLDSDRHLALAVATQNERDRLARDLHDDFTNRVAGMILMVQALRRSPDTSRSGLDDELGRVETAGAEALDAMRQWVATLRATDVELNPELGAVPLEEINSVVEQWKATSRNGRARFHDGTRAAVPPALQTTIYRIIQEAVTNVSRHAPNAEWLEVTITEDGDCLVVRVTNPLDAGSVTDPVPGSSGLGILGMTERASALGGTVDAGPADSSTWVVLATLPLSGTR